jgi:hypothetical protein
VRSAPWVTPSGRAAPDLAAARDEAPFGRVSEHSEEFAGRRWGWWSTPAGRCGRSPGGWPSTRLRGPAETAHAAGRLARGDEAEDRAPCPTSVELEEAYAVEAARTAWAGHDARAADRRATRTRPGPSGGDGRPLRTELVLHAAGMAMFTHRPAPGPMHHSDRGAVHLPGAPQDAAHLRAALDGSARPTSTRWPDPSSPPGGPRTAPPPASDTERGVRLTVVGSDHSSGRLVVSMCGLRAAMTVNRVAMRANAPYANPICGIEKVSESWPEMRLGMVAPL